MKVVIDIPEKAYELLKSKSELDNIAESIIANGIPLPKGHGRLIDADALIPSLEEYKIVAYGEYDEGRNQMLAWICEDILDAPTIIEADKEAENENSN